MGLLNKALFSKEELESERIRYNILIYWFNKINEEDSKKVDQLNYIDYYKKSKEQLTIEEWLEFLSDYRVAAILDKVMLMNMRANVNKLLSDKEDRSVANSQRLNSSLTFLSKYFDQGMDKENVTYIYTSVPLTKDEENAKNARTLLVRPKINPHNPGIPTSDKKLVK